MRTRFGLDCQAVRHHRFGVNWCRLAGLVSAIGLFLVSVCQVSLFLFFGGRVRAGEPTFSLPLFHPLTACPFLFGAAVTPPNTGGEFWIVLLASVACMVAELFKLLPFLRGVARPRGRLTKCQSVPKRGEHSALCDGDPKGPFRGRGESSLGQVHWYIKRNRPIGTGC